MKIFRVLASIAIGAAFSATLIAQPATGYHSVTCIKVKAENGSDFRKWAAEDLHKYAQSRVDSGAFSSWILLRGVIPAGRSAECDYLIVSMYPGIPPHPLGIEDLDAVLKKAGMTMTAQQYVDRRNALITLISNNMFQNEASVGTFKKGDYFVANYMKASNIDDYVAYEKKVWQPLAEAMAKDGMRTGWSLNVQVFPGGSDAKFNAVTVDVFPSWEAIFKDQSRIVEMFRKTHSDMELGTTFEQYEKLRTELSTNIFVVQDLINATK